MISKLLTGVAKSLFILGCSFLAIGGLAVYASWRCLRAAFAKEHGMPVRDATFNLMAAAVLLANALREREIRRLKREAAMRNGNGHWPPDPPVPAEDGDLVAELDELEPAEHERERDDG